MARGISVFLFGNSSSLERAFTRAEAAAAGFNAEMKATGAGAGAAGAFSSRNLLKGVAAVTAGTVAWHGLTDALSESVDAAREAMQTQRQLRQQLEVSGISWEANRDAIDEHAHALSQLAGISDDTATRSLIPLVRVTKDLTASYRLNAIAADVAAGTGRPLQAVSVALAKAYGGQVTALRRLGVAIPAALSPMQAIAFVGERFAGQAAAGATATARLSANMHNLAENVGLFVVPVLDKLVGSLADATDHLGQFTKSVREPGDEAGAAQKNVHALGVAVGFLAGKMDDGAQAAGGWATILKNSFASVALGADALLQVGAGLRALGVSGGGGDGAADFKKIFGGLGDAVLSGDPQHPGFGELLLDAIKRQSISKRDRLDVSLAGSASLSALRKAAQFDRRQLAAIQRRYDAGILDGKTYVRQTIRYKNELESVTKQADAILSGQADDARQLAEERARKAQEAADAAKTEAVAWADFAIERAQATKPLQDDLKAERAKLKLLESQSAIGHRTAAQAQDIWETQQEITRLTKEIAGQSALQAGFHRASAASVAASIPGLTPVQRRALTQRLAGVGVGTGAGLQTHTRTGQFSGGVVIQNLNLHGVQDVKTLADELAKHSRSRPPVRRGSR